MRQQLIYLAVIVAAISAVPYLVHTVQGKTKPNLVTWGTWTLLNAIVMVAALTQHAVQTALFTAVATAATGSIFVAGLRYGYVKFSRFDGICLFAALVGVVLWFLTDEPAIAVAINLAADFAGWLPTFRHAWREPYAETWQTFAGSLLAAALTIASIAQYNFVATAYPAYFIFADGTLAVTVLLRQHAKGGKR